MLIAVGYPQFFDDEIAAVQAAKRIQDAAAAKPQLDPADVKEARDKDKLAQQARTDANAKANEFFSGELLGLSPLNAATASG